MKREGTDQSTVVLLYQMGKVGSTSTWQSLASSNLPYSIYKTHFLSDPGIKESREHFGPLIGEPGMLPHAEAVREVRSMLADGKVRTWKIISLVRDPIARDISSFAQLVHFMQPDLVSPRVDVDKVARAASAHFLLWNEATSYQSRWFDNEIRSLFGIDVFSTPFDPLARQLRITVDCVDLLVLRLEDFRSHFRRNIAQFLGVDAGEIRYEYGSSRRAENYEPAYAEDTYRQILSRVHVPYSAAQRVYASRLARHFYSAAELADFAAIWDATRNDRGSPSGTCPRMGALS